MKKILVLLCLISTSTFAKNWTETKTLAVDFSNTDIKPEDVKVTFDYHCSYKKKYIDIIEGRIGETSKSCGDKTIDLKIVDGKLTLPSIEQFSHSKADTIERYVMQFKLDWKGRNLIWVSAGQNSILNFYNESFDLSFEKFQLKDLEVTFNGINIIDSPEFNGAKTEVTTYFYVKKLAIDYYLIDTDFTRSFKWYLTTFSEINKNDPTKLGKISIMPHYHAFINKQVADVNVTVYAKDKNDQFVSAEKIEFPLTQESIDQFKSVEIKRK